MSFSRFAGKQFRSYLLQNPAAPTKDQRQSQTDAIANVEDSSTLDDHLNRIHCSNSQTGAVGRYDFIRLYARKFPSDLM